MWIFKEQGNKYRPSENKTWDQTRPGVPKGTVMDFHVFAYFFICELGQPLEHPYVVQARPELGWQEGFLE